MMTDSQYKFMNGYCTYLAPILQRRLRLPLGVLRRPGSLHVVHMFVFDGDDVIDALGKRHKHIMAKYFYINHFQYDSFFEKWSSKTYNKWNTIWGEEEVSREEAECLADLVIKDLEL